MGTTQFNAELSSRFTDKQLAAHERGRQNLKPFPPGKSGNPGGWNQSHYMTARKICADKSLAAITRLLALMDDDDGRIAYMACMAVLERGIGKPRDHSEEEALASRISLEGLDKGERAVLAMLLQKALGLDKAKDAAPTVIEGDASEPSDGSAVVENDHRARA